MYQTLGEKTEWLFLLRLQFIWKVWFYWWPLCFCLPRPFCESATTSVCSEQGTTWLVLRVYLNPSWPSATNPYSVNNIHQVGKLCFNSSQFSKQFYYSTSLSQIRYHTQPPLPKFSLHPKKISPLLFNRFLFLLCSSPQLPFLWVIWKIECNV